MKTSEQIRQRIKDLCNRLDAINIEFESTGQMNGGDYEVYITEMRFLEGQIYMVEWINGEHDK